MAVYSQARHNLVLRAIHREIKKGNDVAFWVDKAYAYQDSGLLTDSDISEIETLANDYYNQQDV